MAGIRVIPVIDLKAGQVVRGIAGRRAEYKPVVSQLTRSSEPVEVARAFRDRLGLSELYVADLDAIENGKPAWDTYQALRDLGLRLWVDAGIRDEFRAVALSKAGVENVIAALETLPCPGTLERIVRCLGPERTVFSLDMKMGRPVGEWAACSGRQGDSWQVAEESLSVGVRRLIVLDLTQVGTGSGLNTYTLCGRLRGAFPEVEIVSGGGVRSIDDVCELARAGASAALVASALHDAAIERKHLYWLERHS